MNTQPLLYTLVTPAHNEEAFIGGALDSVVSQTIKPVRWIVVSDGSTDRTDEIVRAYMARHAWIELVRMPEKRDRTFAAKVHAFNAGYARLAGLAYDIVGNLDADISFDPDFLEFLLAQFAANPRLGVAGTPFVEAGVRTYDYRFVNIEHVSGACQLFRRRCFEDIGGYVPIKGGGIDWTAVTTARMKGWQTRTFTEKTCVHHRAIGTGGGGVVYSWFRHGRKDYYTGGHPLWQVFRSAYQMRSRPYGIAGLALLAGYVWEAARRTPRPIPAELIAFHRAEQMRRMRRIAVRAFRRRSVQA